MPFISLIDAGYKYSGTGKWVFRHFDMSIESGETIRIVGRNGSGKTTLLKAISGLLELKEGEFRKQRETKVAYMDQFSGEMLARDLTIAEQLKAAAASESSSNMTGTEKLADFELGLQDRLDEFIGHLSGGQRQIIALLCMLRNGANVLCLDEFTSSLDDQAASVAVKLLTHVRTTKNATLILVSHGATELQIDRDVSMSSPER